MAKSRHRNKKQIRQKPIKWKCDEEFFTVPANPRPVVEFPRPETNSKMEFTLVLDYAESNPQSSVPRSQFGGHSVYDVRYILSIPGVNTFRDTVDFDNIIEYGNSLLQLPIGEHLLCKANDQYGEIDIQYLGNKFGIMSQIRLRLECGSFEEAERIAHERVSPTLSYWSFLYDISIEISNYYILEENTGTRKYSVGLVGRLKPFDNDLGFDLQPDYLRILAAYREAMNASSPFYQALSFCKVIEGIKNSRIIVKRSENKKLKLPSPKETDIWNSDEVIPNDLSLIIGETIEIFENDTAKIAFTKYLGKAFMEVKTELFESIRNPVAHLADFTKVLDADRYDDINACSRAIPVLKYMTRKMLENDLSKT
jgi:hypothetical protein